MPRIPYDIVAIEANKLTHKMLTATTPEQLNKYYDLYLQYLKATGWDPVSFDQETLNRVNKNWEEEQPRTEKPN